MINLKIITDKNNYDIKCKKGISFKDAIKNEDISFRFPCNGAGRCGNCYVKSTGKINKPTRLDEMKLDKDMIKGGYRLGCCLKLNNDTEVHLEENTGFL